MADMLFKYLPLRISRAVHLLPENIFDSISEIRMRKNAPITVTSAGKNIFFDADGRVCNINKGIKATEEEMAEFISNLTCGSLYTCDEYLSQGFIPLPDGGRAGICGRMNYFEGTPIGFSEIYSVNLRIPRFIPEFAMPLIREFNKNGITGTIVCSPPGLGKTTFLKSIAFLLANGKGIDTKRVAIADERCELSSGIPLTGAMDILSGIPKAQGITMLTRTMSPEIIICDEISPDDTQPLLEAQNTGVCLIASAHCKTPRELMKRGKMKLILESGIFPLCVNLDENGSFTFNITKTEEYL